MLIIYIYFSGILGPAHSATTSGSVAGSVTYGGADKVPEGPVGADYGHKPTGTAEKEKRGTPMMVHTKTNYDDIFNVRVVCTGGDVVVHTHTAYIQKLNNQY